MQKVTTYLHMKYQLQIKFVYPGPMHRRIMNHQAVLLDLCGPGDLCECSSGGGLWRLFSYWDLVEIQASSSPLPFGTIYMIISKVLELACLNGNSWGLKCWNMIVLKTDHVLGIGGIVQNKEGWEINLYIIIVSLCSRKNAFQMCLFQIPLIVVSSGHTDFWWKKIATAKLSLCNSRK